MPAIPGVVGLIDTIAKSVGAPALALAYGAGLTLLFQRARGLMRTLAPVGRMALTNYILQSVVGVLVFYGIGLGFFRRTPLTIAVAGALVLFAVQVCISRAWLSRAQFGPAEWLWRMFTYRRRFALRRG
jgi:uncharacterized protein